jgi:hypothetical protein
MSGRQKKVKKLKLGLFLTLFSLSLFPSKLTFADELDEFLMNSGSSSESVFIDIEEKTDAQFGVVDELSKEDRAYKDSLYNPPRFKKRKVTIKPEPYVAQLKVGTILKKINGEEVYRVTRPVVVKAVEKIAGSQIVTILNKDNQEVYTTKTSNAVNIEQEVALNPDIEPTIVYTDKRDYNIVDTEVKFRHFISYHLESIRSDYFPTIYRGTKQTAQGNILESKNYFVSNRFPVQFGFNVNYHFGFWEDPTLGTVTWQGLFAGPSIMRSFWKKKDSRWNMHLNGFKSIFHESKKDPDFHKFSTLGLQLELEKEIDFSTGSYTLGVNYRWSRSSVKETSEFLQNEAIKGQVIGFGVYLSYKFDWIL